MHRSSLLEILRTLSKQELAKFGDFVKSPYFNKKENVVRLFIEISKHAPGLSGEGLEKESLWKGVFPGKEYNYGIMKNLIHELTGLSEKFILLEQYFKDTFRSDYDLIEAANNRNIQKFTAGKIDQFEKRVKHESDPNKYSIIEDLLYVMANYNYAKSSFIHDYELKHDREDSLRLASQHLLYYFLIASFKLIHNTVANEVQGNRRAGRTVLEDFFAKLEEHSILEGLLMNDRHDQDELGKAVTCFYLMYKALISGGDRDVYDRFKSHLRENVQLLSATELKNLNNCRITCAINLKTPALNHTRESLEWYKLLMEKGLLLQRNGLITIGTMVNVINFSVNLNETEFAEEFLNQYAGQLPADSRDNTYNYCLAVIHFARKEYGKSLERLSGISDEKLIRKYFVKRLYLKIYYELNDYESFVYAFDTFAHFKKRNKLTNEARAVAFNNFGNYIRRLFKLRKSYSKFEAEKLRKEAGNQIWFVDKLDELERDEV